MNVNEVILAALRTRITAVFPAQVRAAVEALSEDEIWWRPNESANSIGNLILHLAGSLDHYLNRNVGGFAFDRDRAAEFAERGPIPREQLMERFEAMVTRATETFDKLTPERLNEPSPEPTMYTLLVEDVMNVAIHLANHVGQIVWIAKSLHEGAAHETWIKTHRKLGAWKSA